ncbi:hypothetical protein Pyn_12610 [Prunus yedoensis var. nudiflora]|uniref:Uncharacterized protein n=1 Tax=Prunus yedoensis var. nudiflora TaxID=2094558 RepID=A0A314UY92_PRUYE|nr:hypothetical protein Pyn_12610 [Prunus yedoensis var. nudiflora]
MFFLRLWHVCPTSGDVSMRVARLAYSGDVSMRGPFGLFRNVSMRVARWPTSGDVSMSVAVRPTSRDVSMRVARSARPETCR